MTGALKSKILDLPPMGRKKMGRPSTGRNDASAKIDRQLLGRAQMVAKDRGQTIAEYLTDTLRGPVDRHYAELLKRLAPPTEEQGHGSTT